MRDTLSRKKPYWTAVCRENGTPKLKKLFFALKNPYYQGSIQTLSEESNNKTELIAAVAEASGKSKADVKDVLDALTAQIVKTVKAGDEITLVGFGTFKSAKREARTGRNPATGATIQIPASVQPKFVAGKQFKDALNTK